MSPGEFWFCWVRQVVLTGGMDVGLSEFIINSDICVRSKKL